MGRKPFVASRNKAPVVEKDEIQNSIPCDDYMSESLLNEIKNEEKKKESSSTKKKKIQSQPQSHSSMREEALSTPLPSSNIGFKLLQQMGYK